MNDDYAFLAGEIGNWPSKAVLAEMFKADGYRVTEGMYSVSLDDFDRFIFKELDGIFGQGRFDADNPSEEALIAFSERVSKTLAKAGLRHRFEIYPAAENADMVAYFHHNWPRD